MNSSGRPFPPIPLADWADTKDAAADPRGTSLDFYESAYLAGAPRAGWDVQRLRTPWAPPES